MALQVLICDVLMVLFQVVLSLELPIFDLIDVVLTVIALVLGFWQFIKQSHYCPVKILDLEINRVDHHPLGR